MKTFKIFSDLPLTEPALELLRAGVAPHEIICPARPAASVLGKSEADPLFDEAEVAFGQPDVACVRGSARLRWVQLASAGFTRFDTPDFRAFAARRRLLVTNSSLVYAAPCAEHVFAFMLAQARQLPPALASQCAGGSPRWNELRHGCTPLSGQKVIVLGYGAIAIRLVQLLRPFAMSIVAFRRRARGDEGVPIVTAEQLPQALAEADHVIDILPDNADSRHFFAAERFAAMKPGAVFYNIGRGTTVDQSALVAALEKNHLAAAWLDVTDPEPLPPDHPLLRAPNCHLTPHIAGGHRNEAESLVRHFLANFQRFLAGTPLQDRIM
jgi:phosphoglycerate dehydrogenase-like enzyme